MPNLFDTSPKIERARLEGLRRMPAWRKLALVDDLSQAVRELALAQPSQRYPNDRQAQRRRRLADLLLGADLAARAYDPMEEGNDVG